MASKKAIQASETIDVNFIEITEKTGCEVSVVAVSDTVVEIVDEAMRSLDEITVDVLLERDKIGTSSYILGGLLNEAKKQIVSHGEWLVYLEETVKIPKRTAQRLMQVARGYTDASALTFLGETKALALLKLPKNKRGEFENAAHVTKGGVVKSVGEMTSREFEEAVRKHLGTSTESSETSGKSAKNVPTKRSTSPTQDVSQKLASKVAHIQKSIKSLAKCLSKLEKEQSEFFFRTTSEIVDICDDAVRLFSGLEDDFASRAEINM